MSTHPLRVRIHLNLAQPDLAENVVRIQSPTGAWVTVAYATELSLSDCVPIVDLEEQARVSQGLAKKTPHAFIEGNLDHFVGRVRDKAPQALVDRAAPFLVALPGFDKTCVRAERDRQPINYNPRFARCFYQDQAVREDISQRLVRCDHLVVRGWQFLSVAPTWVPMVAADYCEPRALGKASAFERMALRKGHATTEKMVAPSLRSRGPR